MATVREQATCFNNNGRDNDMGCIAACIPERISGGV
ncbi:MAG: hypothetical protein LBV47_09590 [Bacteroidales bacterium]|nr:hypothetical protein [Bacteroidales bacterium]